MNDFDIINRLVSSTGASFREAKKAYERCGKNEDIARIELEKMMAARTTELSAKVYDSTSSGSHSSGIFAKLSRNYLKVTGKRDYFHVPLFAAIIAAILLWQVFIPLFVISIFCGIKYVFTGPDISSDFVLGFTKPNDNGNVTYYDNDQTDYQKQPDYTDYYEEPTDKGFFN